MDCAYGRIALDHSIGLNAAIAHEY